MRDRSSRLGSGTTSRSFRQPGGGVVSHGRALDASAERVARSQARRLVRRGARAVVWTGSWVRGEAHRGSDLDLWALGSGPSYALELVEAFLVSVSWKSLRRARSEFTNPAVVGAAIPGWREAVVLHDPEGLARAFRARAVRWRWELLGRAIDTWVAESVTGYAEEVGKLVGFRSTGREVAAAAQRSLLALGIPPILAVHRRVLYGTEHRLWDLVADELGDRYRDGQARALGLRGNAPGESCDAALDLYALAAVEVRRLLRPRQRAVVAHACRLAGRPF